MGETKEKMSPFDSKIDELVATVMDELHVPGLALGVIDEDNIWTKGYGVSNVDTGTKVTPKTLFLAGSTAKAFTAAAASLLVDENPLVTWDTPLHKLIPEDFVLEDDYATTHVTLADCLSHRSGFPGHRTDLGGPSLKENVRNLRHLPMGEFQPRATWEYSNHMFWAASLMIEKVSEKSLGDFMSEKLWTPLGMDATFFSAQDALAYEKEKADPDVKVAKTHVWDTEANKLKVVPFWDDRGISGAGAIVSNVEDYAKWIRAFIKQEENLPLSAAGYQAVSSPHMVMPPIDPRFVGPISYGYGWMIAVYRGEKVVFHPGGIMGSVANMIYLPDRKWGVVGMCCSTADSGLNAALWHLVDEHLSTPADKRIDLVDRTKKMKEMTEAHAKSAKDRLFPAVPTTKIGPSLPLDAYLGSYTHPTYGTVTLSESKDSSTLLGAYPMRITLDPFVLEHVTGEHFFVKADILTGVMSIETKARFEIDAHGKPTRLGVEFEAGKPELLIWFVQDTKKEAKDEPNPEDGSPEEGRGEGNPGLVVPQIAE